MATGYTKPRFANSAHVEQSGWDRSKHCSNLASRRSLTIKSSARCLDLTTAVPNIGCASLMVIESNVWTFVRENLWCLC